MIIVDTSVWVDHLRATDTILQRLLSAGEVLCHPLVIGEVLVGNVRHWTEVRETLEALPQSDVASDSEVLEFIDAHSLHGTGINYIDCHLLLSTRCTPDSELWTRDKRLAEAARRLNVVSSLPSVQ